MQPNGLPFGPSMLDRNGRMRDANTDAADALKGFLAGQEAFETRLCSLTPMQIRILAQVAKGQQNKQIAYALGIAETTVKAHVTSLLQRLNIRSRTQAAVRFTICVDRALQRQAAAPAEEAPPVAA